MADKISKVVIFAGGKGTRFAEMTKDTPKPLITVNGEPIVLHIMRHFYAQGYREFILCLGYKADDFKRYFRDYYFHNRNVSLSPYGLKVHDSEQVENWTVHLVDTGADATTGQRLHLVRKLIGDSSFFLTYGDGASDVDLHAVEAKHNSLGRIATITSIPVQERFGILDVNEEGEVLRFAEKSDNTNALINGGFIACSNELLDYVSSDSGDFAYDVLTKLADAGKLGSYLHNGFWKAMDTKKDRDDLEKIFKDHPEFLAR